MKRSAHQVEKTGSGSAGAAALASKDESHVVAAYARWAPIYDWVFGLYTLGPCKIAVAEINRLEPGRVLEVGVGTGISLPHYDAKHRVSGIDLSPQMLDRARHRVREAKLDNIESLQEMDAEHLGFGDETFDTAVAMFFITVVPDPQRALSEMIRVVRPGGRVVIVSHFSVESGPRAWVERWLSRYSSKLGWRPNYPVDDILARPELKLLERRSVKTFDIFTMLVFERVG